MPALQMRLASCNQQPHSRIVHFHSAGRCLLQVPTYVGKVSDGMVWFAIGRNTRAQHQHRHASGICGAPTCEAIGRSAAFRRSR